ncbi:MAG TPA: hypothetical protein VJ867_15135 [Gemmatimonadaceae bacterium]|nr:hypothetical protein [Gemmatimonadaceae bacterium]
MTSSATFDALLARVRALPACELPPEHPDVETRAWPLAAPWPPLRLPMDMFDIAGLTSVDAPQRAFQTAEGDTIQLFLLPAGVPVDALDAGDAMFPGLSSKTECGVVFETCVASVTRVVATVFEETGVIALISVAARSGHVLIGTVSSADPVRYEQLIGRVIDVGRRGPTPAPEPQPGETPVLAVRFHGMYAGRPVITLSEHRPRDTSHAEKEGRDALDVFALEKVRTHWYYPKDIDPAIERIHEEEVREYAEEIVAFRIGEMEQSERSSRSTHLTFVVENASNVDASDVVVRLSFPPQLLVGSFGTIAGARILPPEQPRILQLGPTFLKQRRKRIVRDVEIGNLDDAAREDGWASYERHADGSVTVVYRVSRLAARSSPNVAQPWLMFRSWNDVGPFTIRWEVEAAGVAKRSGTLEVGVEIRTLAQQAAEQEEFRRRRQE